MVVRAQIKFAIYWQGGAGTGTAKKHAYLHYQSCWQGKASRSSKSNSEILDCVTE